MREVGIGFVGGGRVARIMLGGWTKAGRMPAEVVASDTDPAVLARLADIYPSIRVVGSDSGQAARQDIVFVAVHPPDVGAVLGTVKSALRPDGILISLAPKWTIEKIAAGLDGFTRIARMIPNAPSIVGQGFNPIAFSSSLTAQDRHLLAELFCPLGKLPEVEEGKLECYGILTAMGPTYLWPQLYELQSLARSFGLTSGAHLNPAVTLSLAAWSGFSWRRVLPYWATQFLGAFCAAAVLYFVFGDAKRTFTP